MRHYSLRTEGAYVNWVRRFILFHGKRHPKEMGGAEIEALLTHLAVEGHVAASTQNQALSALLFLYREVLRQELDYPIHVVRAKESQHLPEVLTKDEVRQVIIPFAIASRRICWRITITFAPSRSCWGIRTSGRR